MPSRRTVRAAPKGAALLAVPAPWMRRAACAGEDPDLFFNPEAEHRAERAAREAKAKAVCAACPVLRECGEHAVSLPEKYGLWAGLNEDERAAERRHRRRGEAAA